MRRSVLALAAATIVATLAVTITSRSSTPKPRTEPTRHATVEPEAANSFVAAPWTLPNRFRSEETPGPSTDPTLPPASEETTPASEEIVPVAPQTRPPRKAGAPAGVTLPPPRTSGSEAEFLADAVFRKLDANGDGTLTRDEIPTAFRGEVNERGAIDPEMFAKLFQAAVQKSLANQTIAVVAMAPAGGSSPTAISAWFQTLDTDRDGQVSLFEWRTAGGSVAEFQQMDGDGDGLLTRREVQTFTAQQKVPAPTTAGTLAGPSTKDDAHPANATKTPTGGANVKPASRADSLLTYYVTIAAGAAPKSRPLVASGAPAKPAPAPPASPPPAKPAVAAKPAPAPAPVQQPSGTESATLPLPFTTNPYNAYWVMRNEQNLKALSKGKHPSVLFLGDSITDYLQNGVGNPLWYTYYAPLPALDFAIGGIRTSHVLYQVETGQVLMARPKVVVLLIGSNNLGIANQKPEEVAEGVEKIVDEIGAQLPNTRILLLGLLPRGASANDAFRPQIAKVNRLIAPLADGKHVRFLDIGSLFLASDGSITPEIMPDGCHPSLLGYMIYTLAIWPTLADMLKP